MRGCFQGIAPNYVHSMAFPAYAGMFLIGKWTTFGCLSFPRVCGDVSPCVPTSRRTSKLSPRMRGCFYGKTDAFDEFGLSPRMRGCFLRRSPRPIANAAFPAYAGMFLNHLRLGAAYFSFPRVCGDVSKFSNQPPYGSKLSPRMRGCFFSNFTVVVLKLAFPAYAGMFLN